MGNASVCLPCVAQLQRALPPSTTICMIFKIAKPFMDALFAQNSGFHRLNADCEIHIAATPTAPAFGFPADIVAEPPNECRVAPPGTAGLQVLPSCRISGPLRSSRSCDSQRHLVMRCVSILRTQLSPAKPAMSMTTCFGVLSPNQPTCTASIETEPPSTPSTGKVSGSDSVRAPAT